MSHWKIYLGFNLLKQIGVWPKHTYLPHHINWLLPNSNMWVYISNIGAILIELFVNQHHFIRVFTLLRTTVMQHLTLGYTQSCDNWPFFLKKYFKYYKVLPCLACSNTTVQPNIYVFNVIFIYSLFIIISHQFSLKTYLRHSNDNGSF